MTVSQPDIRAIFPATPLQVGMLFHSQLAPGSGVYVVQETVDLHGDLDSAKFRAAWQAVLDHYAALKVHFLRLDTGAPLQIVRDSVALPWREEDWTGLSPEDRQRQFLAQVVAKRKEGFDPLRAPLMTILLARTAPSVWRLLWSRHHAVCDGWSAPIVLQTVLRAYKNLVAGRKPAFPAESSFEDYVAWLSQQDPARAAAYWASALDGYEGFTNLAIADLRDSAAQLDATWERVDCAFSAEQSESIVMFVRKHRLTLNTVAQAAWALLLSSYSDRADVMFGAVSSGRADGPPGADTIVGCLLNTLPARIKVEPQLTLQSWLRGIKTEEIQREAFGHAALLDIQKWSGLRWTTPPFSTLFVFENYPMVDPKRSEPDEIRVELVGSLEQTSFPLALYVVPGHPISLSFRFSRAVYQRADISTLSRHYRALVCSLLDAGDAPLSAIGLGEPAQPLPFGSESRAEREEVHAAMIHARVLRTADRLPDAVAIFDGDCEVSYRTLVDAARRISAGLRAQGISTGARIGICMSRHWEMVAAMLGVLHAGMAYIPLDPAYPDERLRLIVSDAVPATIIGDALQRDRFDAGMVVAVDDLLSAEAEPNDGARLDGSAPAYILYTSGSTGTPKGVVLTHDNASFLIDWAQEQFGAAELAGILASSSVCFDLSIFEIFVPLACGGAIILAENLLRAREAPHYDRITLINSVPSVMDVFLRDAALPRALKTVNLAGEPLSRDLASRIYRHTPEALLYNLYGPTEATTYVSVALIPRDESKPLIGRPIRGAALHVLGPRGESLPAGLPGELFIEGRCVAAGYLNRPELTEQRFVTLTLDGRRARVYRTGDLVRRLAGGSLDLLGRVDRQIKIRGIRIEPSEIEALLKQYPGITDAVVVPWQSPQGASLVGYVAPRADVGAVREWLTSRLPQSMVPSEIIALDAMPLNANGKLDQGALPEPGAGLCGVAAAGEAPRSRTEGAIAAIWKHVLALPYVSTNAPFFEIGGNSLLLIQVHKLVREQFGASTTIADLFKYPTIAELARHLDGVVTSSSEAPVDRFAEARARLARRKTASERSRGGPS